MKQFFREIKILLIFLVAVIGLAWATEYITRHDTNYDGTDEYSLDTDGNGVFKGNVTGVNGVFSGTVSITGNQTNAAKMIQTPQIMYGMTASSTCVISSSFIIIASTGTGTLSAATPFISTATATNPNGTWVTLTGGTTAIILQDNDLLSNTCLQLGGTTRTVGQKDILTLLLYDGKWLEVTYTDN